MLLTVFISLGSFLASAGFVWGRRRQFQQALLELFARQKVSQEKVNELQAKKRQLLGSIQERELSIQEISDLYGLSKQFLGTLDWRQALQASTEALSQWLPSHEEGSFELEKIRQWGEKEEVSLEKLEELLQGLEKSSVSLEREGILRSQLALGLRRAFLYHHVQQSAIHDGLTGLVTRRYFRERLEEEVVRALRRDSRIAFLMVDLDHFKKVNDTYGHLVGDVVLRDVAHLIRRSVREIDLVGRYGGEEFGVVLPDSARDFGMQIAKRIREVIEQASIRAYDEKVHVTVSIGAAMCPEDAQSADELIERADQAMYQAKSLGRNRIVTVGEPS